MDNPLSGFPPATIDQVREAFVDALSRILKIARFRFRHVACSDSREDAVSETVAICWMWYLRLVGQGRNPTAFIASLAHYGAKAVKSGRRVCGQERANDVLSPCCQHRRQLRVSRLQEVTIPKGDVIADALCDNTQTPVPDQVQFRHDFAAWKGRLPRVRQRLVRGLALGHRTKDLAVKFGLSESRVSQLRREFADDYATFCGDTIGTS